MLGQAVPGVDRQPAGEFFVRLVSNRWRGMCTVAAGTKGEIFSDQRTEAFSIGIRWVDLHLDQDVEFDVLLRQVATMLSCR